MNKTHLFIQSPQTQEGYSHASPQFGGSHHPTTVKRRALRVAATVLRLRSCFLALLSLAAALPLQAAAVNVRIVGLSTAYCAHDVSEIATQLNGMLAATPGYSGSSAAATVFSGRSLTEAYYYPSYRDATRAVVVGDYDYIVILPETTWLYNYPEMTFDGVLQMSRKALGVGTTPLLLMPGTGTSAYINTLGTHSYRIGNGCGIHVVPGGYAAQSANQLSITANQSYLLAATIFNKITGLNAASGTSYVPASVSNYSSLAGTAVTTNNTHNSTVHYTTSRENSGLVRYRAITPAGNSLRYAKTGTSTEQGISVALTPILQASGYTVNLYSISSEWGWTSAMATSAATNFATYPGQYTLGYFRSPFIAAASSTLTDPNQANMLTIAYDQQYTGMSNTGTLEDFYDLTETARGQCVQYGFSTVPIHLGAARLNDVDSSLAFSSDGTHWTSPFYNMIAAMMATTSLGREPTPPAAVLADSSLLKGFNVGKQLVRQLAFLSETEAHCPDTALAITTPPALTAVKNQAFTYNFTATGGTSPYIWTVESGAGLPAGLALSPNGSLSGITTADAGNWQLVIQVKDSTGAIRKIPATLSVALSGSGAGALAMTSGDGLSAYGNAGGPFSPNSQVYTLSNVGTTSINWTAAKTQSWVTLTPASGTLAAGANTTVTVSINSNADVLAANTYSDTVTFTNTTNNNGNTTRGVSLTINSLSANLTWDANGTTAGQTDGAGAWLSANQWWNGTANANWTSSRNATFGNGGAGGAVTLASPTTVNGLAFNAFTGTYALGTSGQTLTLNGGITVDAAAGAVSLVSPVSLGFPQTWANHSASTLTASSAISGSGGLTKSGTGTMVLAPDTDNSSYAGATTVAGGVLNIQKSTALGSVTSGTSVSSGATLQIQGGISVGAEPLALDGSGVSSTGALRNISGTNFYGGLLTLNGAARIQSDAGTLVLSNTGTITGSGAALTVAGAGNTSIMGNIATGTGSITKEGAGTLTLYGVSTYSGGTTINGGNINLATTGTDSLGAANSSVTVNASTTLTANGNTTLQKSFAINNSSSLTFANATSHITVTGAVTGNGGVRPIGGATALGQRTTTLSSTSNSFTGPISNPSGSNFGDLSVNSLYDGVGAGDITFGESGQGRTMRLQWGSGATGPLSLSTRRIVLIGSTPTANISNNNATAANAITIHNDLLNSQTGAGTLELGGFNTGNNRFIGNITNGSGGGTLGFTKSGAGTWALSGTNTYSGTTVNAFTNPANGVLIFQGLQALPTSTTLQQTHSGGTGGFVPIRLLDDSATPPSRTGVNLAMLSSSASHTMTLFVGNNSTANGGTSSSTQTGSTISLGNLNFTQNASGNTSQTLTVNGTNNYGLSIQNIDLPSLVASSTTWTGVMNPTSAPLTVAGTVRQKSGSVVGTMTLKLDGTAAGNRISGTITDSADATPRALALSKTSSSIWTLSGTNSYTGTTTVSAGKLFIDGDQSLATGDVSVAANATLGGTGTLGGNTTIAASGKLEFTISSTAPSHDKLELATGKALTFSGASTLTINSPGAAGPGTYTLITAPGGITGVAPATVNLPSGWVATATISGNDLQLVVTETPGSAAGDIVVTPGNTASFSGTVGGPFPADSVTYTLTNGGAAPVNWTASKSANWVNLSTTSGTLAVGASTTVTVSVNSNANVLAVGSYTDAVTITDTTNGGSTARDVNLSVTPAPYVVSYNGNGNTGGTAPSNQLKPHDVDLILSDPGTLVRTGFSFAGWNTASDGSGTPYAAGATYAVNAALALHAQWNAQPVANAGANQTVSLSGEGWSPADISPLSWYDASDANTLWADTAGTTAATTSIARWDDKAGSNDMVQATGTKQPVISTTPLNGLNTITFDGSDDALKTATNPFGGSISNAMLMGVFNVGTITQSTLFSLSSSGTTRWQSHAPWQDGNLYFDCGGASGTNRISGASGFSANQNKLLGYYCSTTENLQQVWVDGTNTLSDATGHTVTTAGGISLAHDGSTSFDNCRMGEVVILNGTVSATNRQKLEGYLAHKWGLATNLPAGHPYKTQSPSTISAVVNLDGTVSDPAGDPLTTLWTVVSGPGTVLFGDPNVVDTTATFTVEGTYILRLTSTDAYGSSYDECVINVGTVGSSCSVTYDGNGNTGGTIPEDSNSPYAPGATVTVLGNTGNLVSTGYLFAGWNTAANGSGNAYAPGATFEIAASTTLYAQWATNIYNVTYNANGATSGTAPFGQIKSEGVNLMLATNTGLLARTGFAFAGWNTASDGSGTNYAAGGFYNTDAAITLYAKWTPLPTYTVTYNGNGSTGGTAPTDAGSPYFSGTTVTVLGNTGSLVRTGYTFAGWNTAGNGSGTAYAPAATFTISANTTLYAQWTASTYTVTFDKQSGTGGSTSVTATYGSAMPAATAPTRTGYTFGGYYTAINGGGTQYYTAAMASAANWNLTAATTLYAKWTANSYTVTFDTQGGTGGSTSVSATYGSAMPAATAPTRTGYTFGGYYTAINGGGTQYYTAAMASAANWNLTAATTLYAKWTANSYTVTFDTQGGTGGSASVSATYGSTMPAATAPTRSGYNFGGYYTSAGGIGTQYYTAAMASAANWNIASATTLYAKWTVLTPEMDVTRSASPVADGGYNEVTGTTASTGTPLTFTISNSGQGNLTMSGAVQSGASNCTVVIDTQPSSPVLPSSSTNLVVTVTPTASGAWSFNLSIGNNDDNENPYNWTVHGVTGGSATAIFYPSIDTYIDRKDAANPHGTWETIALNSHGQQDRNGLVKFDLSSIPVDATVSSASLNLYSAGGGQTGTVALYNTLQAWTESITWNSNNASNVIGTTLHATSASTSTATAGTAIPTLDVLSLAQGWVATPSSNNGFAVKTGYTTNSDTSSVLLCSANHPTPEYRPKLTLSYTSGIQAPEIRVSRADAVVTDGGTDTVAGSLPGVGTQLSYAVANLGNANLTLTTPVTATAVSNCSITVNTQPSSPVAASSDTTLVVTVTPTAAGSWSATLSIANNDSDEAPYNWTISGSTTGAYTVSFDTQGGTGGSTSVSATLGLPMPAATAPTRTGYTFGGYYTAINGGGTQYYTAAMASAANWDIAAATTLYAKWTANSYTVTLDTQGGTGGSASVTATYGSAMPAATAPTRTGYSFGGYYTAINGGGTQYYTAAMASAANWNLTAATTLYAQWTANSYTVTLDTQGGTGGSTSVSATYGSAMPAATAPTRTGYTFGGYYTAINGGGTQHYTAAMASAANWNIASATTLYAKWTEVIVDVVTDTNTVSIPEGGTQSFQVKLSAQPSATVTVSVSRTSGDNNITVQSGTSLTFTTANWDTYQTVTLAAANDADADNGSATITCDVSYAAYTDKNVTANEVEKHTTLTIANDGNGTTAPSGAVIVEKNAATAIAATANTGYNFVNWTQTSGTADFADANSASTTATITAPATVRANFTPDTYVVTYNGNGNTGGTVPANQDKVHDINLTLATNSGNLSKTDFTFSGWNTAADGSGTDYAAGGTYSANAPITLYAKWLAGADGTWVQTTAGPFNWGDAANWSGGTTVATGTDRTANFTANLTAGQTVNLESARTIGNITFTDSTTSSNDLTISGTNALTLSRSSGKPILNVTQSGRKLTISSKISGSSGLQKDGAGELILSGTNDYTGDSVLNGGQLTIASSSALGNSTKISVGANSTIATVHSAYPSISQGLEINSGFTATLNHINQFHPITFAGALAGSGMLQVYSSDNGAGSITSTNTANTFTGAIQIGAVAANKGGSLSLNSLADSAAAIGLGNGSATGNLTFGGGVAAPLVFASRPVQLTGTTGGGTISNNATNAANTVSIAQNLAITGTGNKTLTLGGSNTGNNVFGGNIADGTGSVISLTKARLNGGTWALSGTNTYSGNTTLGDGSGTLIIRGKQALSPNSTVVLTQSSSAAFHLKLLDDTAGTVSLPNTFGLDTGNASMGGIVFVGNNNTANGGNSSGTTTGSTISLNKVTPWGLGNAKSLHGFKAEGANGYILGINNLEIPAFSSTTFTSLTGWTMQLTANSAPIAITGTVQQLAGSTSTTLTTRTFEFGGSNVGSSVSGDIRDSADGTPVAWRVIKSGTGTWDLSGTNSYTGTTTVSSGKLFINGDSSAATGAVSVASGATLGGNGALGGSVTIASGGKLEFDLSTTAASYNPLDLSSGKDFTFSGSSTLTITSSGGASTGTYTLVTGGNNLIGVAPATLVLPSGWAATVSISGNSLVLNVTDVGVGPLDHFAISTIPSPQTVGTPITGITITAQDAANRTVTSFTGTVTFGGSGGFSGTSANFVNGVLTNVSVTPTTAGSNLAFVVSDGAGHFGSATIATIRTLYTAWSGGTAFTADSNGDGVKDGLAWILGATSPSGSMQGKLPVAALTGNKLRLTFRCLKSTKRGGAQLHIQTSSDLGVTDPWTNHATLVPDTDQTINDVIFDTTDDGDFIQVTADIPVTGNKLFSRLVVTE